MRISSTSGPPGLARRTGGPLLAAALLLPLCGCAAVTGPTTLPAFRASADSLAAPAVQLGLAAERKRFVATMPPLSIIPAPQRDKVHPKVRQAIARAVTAGTPDAFDTLLVTFRDPLAASQASIQQFTGKFSGVDSTHTLTRAQVADSLTHARAALYGPLALRMQLLYRATELQRYWIVQALLVRMPLSLVDSLSRDDRVLGIDPLHGGAPPQPGWGCGGADYNLGKIRDIINSDPYVRAGYGGGKFALLDTGVRSDHALLGGGAPGKPLERLLDCSGALGDCVHQSVQDDADLTGHGTSTAAILARSAATRSENQGITMAKVCSYKIYGPPAAAPEINTSGAIKAIQDAMSNENRDDHDVIVAEIAEGYGAYGSLTGWANWAYDMGAVVIAANGNYADLGIPQPANAQRVLGVGMYCANDLRTFRTDAAWGVTPDFRIKPDLAGPTGAWTATNSSSTSMGSFIGTSGATPVVAAAARLLRNRMESAGAAVPPGEVYAMLLMCGQKGAVDPQAGAGLIRLPKGGDLWWGPVTVTQGQETVIPLPIGNRSVSGLEAAIWWGEYGAAGGGFPSAAQRAWVSLEGQGPNTGPPKVSADPWSTFQRISVGVPVASGQNVAGQNLTGAATEPVTSWSITVKGKWVPGWSREVYYAVWTKP